MTNILELLKNEKVEWKKLGEVGEIKMCKRILKSQTSENGEIPFYKIGTFGKQPDSFISKELFLQYKEKYSYPKPGEILLSASGTIGRTVIFNGEDAYFQDSNIVWLSHDENKILNKYLYYFYHNVEWNPANGGTIKRLYNYNLANIEIPVPSLETQEKIVEILDKFTNYVTELQSELQSRTKQYTYYRDKLLSKEYLTKMTKEMGVNKKLNLVKLEGIANYCDGTHQTPKYQEKGIPFVSVENIKDLYGTKKYISEDDYKKYKYTPEKDDIFMTRIGDIGTCSVVQDNRDLAYYVTLALIKPNREIVDSKYLKLYIESSYGKRELNKRILHYATPIKVNLGDIGKIKVLLPPLHVQQHVVSILDKFDTLVNDLKVGLPKEIEQRQKQYEYWRECLLNFPR